MADNLGGEETKVKRIKLDQDVRSIQETGRILSSQYEIIKRILAFLPYILLKKCQLVCQEWENVGSIIIKERNKGRAKVFFWEGKAEPQYIEANKQDVRDKLNEFSEKLMFEPALIIAFSTGDFREGIREMSGDQSWLADIQEITNKFPSSLVVGTMITGLIGSREITSDGGIKYSSTERENIRKVIPCLSMIFVPAWPEVDFKPITLPAVPLFASNSSASVILLNDDTSTVNLKSLLDSNPGISLGGGLGELCWSSSVSTDLEFYVDQIGKQHASHHFTEIFQLPQKDPLFRGLGFSLAGSVSSATVVLSRKVRSQKAVEKKLIELKESIKTENSFGLMFACCGRGKGFYRGKSNLESGVFNKLFPTTPLIGIFGNGEIGLSSPYTPEIKEEDLFHSYSTVFMIISRKE